MPLFFAPFFAFGVGALLTLVAPRDLGHAGEAIVGTRPFAIVTLYALLVLLPSFGYFVAFHGDWAYLYRFPWQRVPSAIDLAALLVAAAAAPLGFAAAGGSARAGKVGLAAAIGGSPLFVLVVLAIAFKSSLGVSATYAQYRGDFGVESIGESSLGRGVLLMGIVVLAGAAWAANCIRQGPRTTRSGAARFSGMGGPR